MQIIDTNDSEQLRREYGENEPAVKSFHVVLGEPKWEKKIGGGSPNYSSLLSHQTTKWPSPACTTATRNAR